jgi:hypothetical protein
MATDAASMPEKSDTKLIFTGRRPPSVRAIPSSRGIAARALLA